MSKRRTQIYKDGQEILEDLHGEIRMITAQDGLRGLLRELSDDGKPNVYYDIIELIDALDDVEKILYSVEPDLEDHIESIILM